MNLAELKGRASSIPNQGILIDTLMLQEAAASSEIENIVTTQDELFQIDSRKGIYPSPEAKEVGMYGEALRLGYSQLVAKDGMISSNQIIALFQTLKGSTKNSEKFLGLRLRTKVPAKLYTCRPNLTVIYCIRCVRLRISSAQRMKRNLTH